MKFKNKHILLISLISIFLLLSLSAVSAADDMDNQLLSDNSISDVTIDEINDLKDANKLSQGENTEIISEGEEGGDGEDPVVAEPVDTTIESENTTFKYGDNIKVDVSVKDNESNPIDITMENLEVYKITFNGTDYNTTNITATTSLNNESKLVLKQLSVGDYILNIKFLGNETFAASEKNVTLNITQTNTNITASDVKVKIGDDIIIPITIKVESNKTLNVNASSIKVIIGEQEFNCTNETGGNNISTGIKVLNTTDLTKDLGTYSIKIVYSGNDNCNGSDKTITLTVLANNTITADDTIKVNNHTQNVTIPIVVTNTNITTTYNEETEKNETNVNVTNLTVTKEDLIILLTYFDGTDNITEVIASDDYNLTGEPGNYTINFFTDKLDNSTVTIIFANDTFNEANKTLNLIGFINANIIPINVIVDFQDGNFTFKLVDADTEDILPNTTVQVRGVNFYTFSNGTSISPRKEFTSDENGLIVIENVNMNTGYDFSSFVYNYTFLNVGKYNFTFTNTNSSMVLDNTTQVTINPVTVKIVASNYKEQVGSGKKFVFQLVNSKTNKPIKLTPMQFKVKIGSKYSTFNTTTNMTGECTFNINLIPNTYPATITTRSSNVVKTTVNKTITVTKKPGVLSASNRTILFGSDATAIIRFTDKKTGKAISNGIVKVRLYTTSSKYVDLAFLTNKTGYVKFNAALAVGKHKMVISSADTNYSATSITRYVTVKKASGKFSASNVNTYYKSGKLFTLKLTNTKNKHAIYGGSVNIKVYIAKNRFYNYTGTTDGNGAIRFKISYKPGTYKVVISNNDKGYSAKSITKSIKVSKHPLKYSLNSLSIKKGNTLKVKVISKKTKKVLSGVKVKIRVYTGKKYSTYTRKTNKKGIASLKISKKVGKHKIIISPASTSYYSGKRTSTLKVTKK